jgi:hypothetical protein
MLFFQNFISLKNKSLNESKLIDKDHLPLNYKGQIQYYFSDKNSLLPVRDVINSQKKGFKTEPHFENGSENFLKKCMQSNIVKVINNDVKYLFLLTRCMNKKLPYYKNQYIVGFIKINNILHINKNDNKWKSVQGDIKIVNWNNAIPVLDYYTKNFDRPRIGIYGKFDNIMVNEFLNWFKNKKDI